MKENERKAENKMQKNAGIGIYTSQQKGITLIALIITIIVMLILVGVTISVALNGGLFTTAQTATKETQIEADREQLLSAVVASYKTETGTISESELGTNLGDEWTVSGDGPYTVTSPKENVFIVDVNGNITDKNGSETGGIEGTTPGEGGTEGTTPGTGGETGDVSANSYTFTISEIMQKGTHISDSTRMIPVEDFWPNYVSDELKNNAFVTITAVDIPVCTNITCSDSRFNFPFNDYESGEVKAYVPWTITICLLSDSHVVVNVLDGDKEYVDINNYINSGFEDLEITIGLPE